MAASSEDRFADFLLSLVGEELPLSTEKQALIVSLLGVYVLFTVLLVLLLSLLGLGSCSDLFCWEWPAICRRSHARLFQTFASLLYMVTQDKYVTDLKHSWCSAYG